MKAKSIPYSKALAALALTAGLALGLSRPAHAGGADVFWSVTMSSPGVHVGVANGPVVVRERVYVPRVVHPHPPVIYAPPRVVYGHPGHPGRHYGHYHGRGHDRHDRHDWHRHDRRDRDDDRRHGGRGRDDDRGERHGRDRGDHGDHRGGDRGGHGHRLAQR